MSDTATKTPKTPKRTTEDALLAAWSHVLPGTLRFEESGTHAQKQTVEVKTRDTHGAFDGNTKRVATSDLFQSFWTADVKDALVKARNKAKRSLVKAATREAALAELESLDSPERARAELGAAAPVKAKRVRKSKADAAAALGL